MKLYGKELDKELARRKEAKNKRLAEKKTLREAAKTNDMGLSPSEYFDWEIGADVCPHEEWEKSIGGCHPPFFLMEVCSKCGKANILAKVEDKKEWEENKDALEEAFLNIKKRASEK